MKDKPSRKKGSLKENFKLRLPPDYAWKVLGALTGDLCYLLTESEKTRLGSIIRDRDYGRYLALSEDWGPQSINPCDISLAQFRAKYQLASLLKKFRFPSDDVSRRKVALEKFTAAELHCRKFNRYGIESLLRIEDKATVNVINYAKLFLEKLLGFNVPSIDERTCWSRHGPGANLDTKDRRVNKYYKYTDWPYSCTSRAVPEAVAAIKNDERWLGALEDSYRQRNNIPRYMILDQETFWSSVIKVVPGNKITFVPKNAQTDRSIAIEPAMNLYLQLGIDGYIRKRLKRWNIDLDSQAQNRELARQGSSNWESPDTLVTLDLSAASDTISVSLCYHLLPVLWFDHLMKLRSPRGTLDGRELSYGKISSMGNGYTFALETAIFASIIYGVRRQYLGQDNFHDCSVYGDDIIVPKSIAEEVVTCLNHCGFSVNVEKSFFQGPFRESCGADWFKGKPVRPVFLTSSPSSVMELWTDANRLRRILSLRFCEEESLTVSKIMSWIPSQFSRYKGPCSDESFDSYMHTPEPPVGSYKGYMWVFRRLVARPVSHKSDQFLFRKLMHDLRGTTQPSDNFIRFSDVWKGLRLEGSGSCFTVTKPGSVTVAYSFSVANTWRSEYAET